MSVGVKFASIALLGWNFFLHLFRKFVLRKKSPGYEAFVENYRADRITAFTATERERLRKYSKCIACGLCDPVCPSMKAGGRAYFAGPMDLAMCISRDPTEYGAAPDQFRCLLCKACDRACPESVPVSEIIKNMRAKARVTHPHLLPAFYKEAAINLAKTGNVYGAPRPHALPNHVRALYWRGCAENRRVAAGGASEGVKLLEAFGIKYQAVVEDCCGGMPDQMGIEYDATGALDRIRAAGVDLVLTGCPLCLKTLQKALPEIKVRHVLGAVAEKITDAMKPLAGQKVAYHDSCVMGRGLGIYDLPRDIIEKLGAELIPLERERERAPCCGGGGAVGESDPELAAKIARDRIEEIVASGAPTLITPCVDCTKRLRNAVGEGESLKITTLMEAILSGAGASK